MRDTPTKKTTRVGVARLFGIGEVLLETHKVVTGKSLCAAVHKFRRWDHLVRRPLVASAYSLSLRQTQDLLQSIGMPAALIRRVFDTLSRRQQQSGSWSRVLGEIPERRIDALELFSGLALTCRGTLKDKLSTLFYLFDSDETGVLTEDDLGAMISSCASILRQLGLSLPISSDQAAFVAGEAFGNNQPRIVTSAVAGDCNKAVMEREEDEIDEMEFLEWAQRGEFTTHSLELLHLPHRFSRTVDLMSIAAKTLLGERYNLESTAGCRSATQSSAVGRRTRRDSESTRPLAKRIAPTQRLVHTKHLLPRGSEGRRGGWKFTLPPFLCRVGVHSVEIMLEISTCDVPTAEESTCRVVISVDERNGPRFCPVDSQQAVLRCRTPEIIALSKLRAATDHRLTITWDVGGGYGRHMNNDVKQNFPGGRQDARGYRVLRYTTLPSDSLVARTSSERGAKNTITQILQSDRRRPVKAKRRCIKLASRSGRSMEADICLSDEAHLLQPLPTGERKEKKSRGTSVVITHGGHASLVSTEGNGDFNQRWDCTLRSRAKTNSLGGLVDSGLLLQSWPTPMRQRGDILQVPPTVAPVIAPFSGQAISQSEMSEREQAQSLMWDGGEVGESGDIEMVVHLSPDWRAVEVVRRCFQILEQCRFESLGVRECGKRMVSAEIVTAIRSLMSKSFRLEESALRGRARRSSAHVVLGGLQHPWLGLDEDELMAYDERHRRYVRSEIDSAFRKYATLDDSSGGAQSSEGEAASAWRPFSTTGGVMTIGCGCFVVRPRQPEKNGNSDSSPTINSREENENQPGRACTLASSSSVISRKDGDPRIDPTTTGIAGEMASPRSPPSPPHNSSPVSSLRGDAAILNAPKESSEHGSTEENQDSILRSHSQLGDEGECPLTEAAGHGEGEEGSLSLQESEKLCARDSGGTAMNAETGMKEISSPAMEMRASLDHDLSNTDSNIIGSMQAESEEILALQNGRVNGVVPDEVLDVNQDGPTTLSTRKEAAEVVAPPGNDYQARDGGRINLAGDIHSHRSLDATAQGGPKCEQAGEAFDGDFCNSVLKSLIDDMTKAAQAIVKSSAAMPGVGSRNARGQIETPGCTAIIFLDAPLITHNNNPPGKLHWQNMKDSVNHTGFMVPPHGSSDLAEEISRESIDFQDTNVQDAATTSSPRRPGSSPDAYAISSSEKGAVDDSCDDGDAHSSHGGSNESTSNAEKQHPAGLGDPSQALQSLLAWIGQGTSSGIGRREVLLICCCGDNPGEGSAASEESSYSNFFGRTHSDDSAAQDGGDSGKSAEGEEVSTSGGNRVIQRFLQALRGGKVSEGDTPGRVDGSIARANDASMPLPEEGRRGKSDVGDAAGDSRGREPHLKARSSCHTAEPEQPAGMIRQIVLGRTPPIPIAHKEYGGQRKSVLHQAEGVVRTQIEDHGEALAKISQAHAVVTRLEPNQSGGRNVSKRNPSPSMVELAKLLPSEILLQTRDPAPSEENFSRVALSFSPPSAIAVSPELSQRGNQKHCSELPKTAPSAIRQNTNTINDSVRVLVGPVIGRVGPSSAVVLLEVATVGSAGAATEMASSTGRDGSKAADASDEVGVQLTDTLTGRRFEMTRGTWAGNQPGKGPRIFNFDGLNPGRRYTLKLLGVRRRDQIARTGGFCTPMKDEAPPAMWGLSPLAAPIEALEEILADVQTSRPTATATLTIGPMVSASKVGQVLYPLVISEKKSGTSKEGGLSIRDQALNVFRELYRQAWDDPRTRKLFANTSVIPSSTGAGDLLLPLLSNFPPGWLPLNPTMCGVGRIRRRVRGVQTNGKKRKAVKSRSVHGTVGSSNHEEIGVSRALRAVAEAALQVSTEYQGALLGGPALYGDGSSVRHVGGGRFVLKDEGTTNRLLETKEFTGPPPTFQRWGSVGVLNVSVTSSQIDLALGRQGAGHRLLSREAWAWLESFFRSPEISWQREGPGLSTLIVVTDSPLVWRSGSSLPAMATRTEYHHHEASALPRTERVEGRPYAGNGEQKRSGGSDRGSYLRNATCWGGERSKTKLSGKWSSCESERGARTPSPSWSSHPREAAYLLSLLFSWATATNGDDRRIEAWKTSTVNKQPSAAVGHTRKVIQENPIQQEHTASGATAGEMAGVPRSFSIVCPSTRVQTNIETYVKDKKTGRVAVQWSLASKNAGDEALIPMSGSVSSRFSFTHYPQADIANGPGATLIRPIPDPSAPLVKFLGMSPRWVGDTGGGPGFAFGTLGPTVGEVGTSTARVLVEVSVPMELTLTVKKLGANGKGGGSEPAGYWQQWTKIIPNAHRPIVFEVEGLIPDTRYVLDFSPLANASEFRASLQTRALRPFSFRVAAFGGSRKPFGFFPPADAPELVTTAGTKTLVTRQDSGKDAPEIKRTKVPRFLRERWPFCTVHDSEGLRETGDASSVSLQVPVGGVTRGGVTEARAERADHPNGEEAHDVKDVDRGGRSLHEVGVARGDVARGDVGGGWRHPVATALAIDAATNQAFLSERDRESLLGNGGDDALSLCAEFCRSSAWKAMADEVVPLGQGFDLVIHLGNEIHATASLNMTETEEITEAFNQQPRRSSTQTLPSETSAAARKEAEAKKESGRGIMGGAGCGRPLLLRPPQLPVDDLSVLGERDEKDISLLEEFFTQVHDEAERDRKRDNGEFRHHNIAEPSLAIHIDLPENNEQHQRRVGRDLLGQGGAGDVSGGGDADAGIIDDGKNDRDSVEATRRRERPSAAQEAWALVTEEVAERVRDPYRLAWGLPWARAIMTTAPNACLAFTPLDLDDGFQPFHPPPINSSAAASSQGATADDSKDHLRLMDHPASVSRVRKERHQAWSEYQAALSTGSKGGKKSRKSVSTSGVTAASGEQGQTKNKNDNGAGGSGGGGDLGAGAKKESDRGAYLEFGSVGILMLDVWENQPWRLDEPGGATAKGGGEGAGFNPKALLSKRQEKLVKKALTSSSANALLICSGTPMVAEPIVHPKAPPLSESEQNARDKTLSYAKKELRKLGKAGLAEIKRMEEEEKIPKLAMLSPDEVGAMGNFYDEARPSFQWNYHSPYLQELLEKLFDWVSEGAMPTKKGQPRRNRDVVLICGGTGCGVRTEVRDKLTGKSITQVCVGRVSDSPTPCPWPMETGAIGDRITFSHSPVISSCDTGSEDMRNGNSEESLSLTRGKPYVGENHDSSYSSSGLGSARGKSSFGLFTVLSEPHDVHINAAVVQAPNGRAEGSSCFSAEGRKGDRQGKDVPPHTYKDSPQHRKGVAVIVGPVVGRVEVVRQSGTVRESCRVPVLLEVDGEGKVTCLMRDVATSETFREERVMKARRPRAFWIQGLRPARRYAIEFDGVSNAEDRTGSLTTPDSSHPDLNFVAVSHDRPGELPGAEGNLWAALGERLSSPWQGVDVVVHLGGQVDLSNAFEDGKTCLQGLEERRKAGKVSETEEAAMMGALKERLREEYRKVWNQSCTRRVLASAQHVMMWGQGECRRGYGKGEHMAVSSWAGRRLLRLAKEVFYEYQKQLRDPLWGSKFKVEENESFYLTFLRGTVGVLSLDALEFCPQWENSGGNSGDVHTEGKVGATAAMLGSELDSISSREEGAKQPSNEEKPLIGEAQWQLLKSILDEQKTLVTLIVVTETPIAWHDTETFLAETKDSITSNSTRPLAPHLEDHWVARPTQQRAILMRLYQWKANNVGKEVVLLAAAGRSEGCVASETRLDYKSPIPRSQAEEEQTGKGTGTQAGEDWKEEQDKEKAHAKVKRRLVAIEQIICGPITGEPMMKPTGSILPSKGKLFVPLTETEKQQVRLAKANGYATSSGGSSDGSSLTAGVSSKLEDQPVEFMHLKTWGRNYAVLQVIADKDEEGPIGVVDSELATFSSLDKTHPTQELARPPRWWTQRCIGDRTVLLDDDVYLKGRDNHAAMEARSWLETNEDFIQAISRCYDDFHIADCGRPFDLRTIRVDKAEVLKRQVEDGIRAVYRTLPVEVATELAYVPDQMILDFLFIKACPEIKMSALDTGEKWEDVCRQTCIQAIYIRVAALWEEEEDKVVLMADALAEKAKREEEEKQKRRREKEIRDAEKEAAEMADLIANDPEAHMRRVVQKRAEDADRRKREMRDKNLDDSVAEEEKLAREKKKEEDKERLAREAKEKDAKEQQELNELADSDPAEYDRRMNERHKRKLEGRDGTSSSLSVGSDGDGVDQTQNGDLERRKALARERRDARRAAFQARPPIGLPKK